MARLRAMASTEALKPAGAVSLSKLEKTPKTARVTASAEVASQSGARPSEIVSSKASAEVGRLRGGEFGGGANGGGNQRGQ